MADIIEFPATDEAHACYDAIFDAVFEQANSGSSSITLMAVLAQITGVMAEVTSVGPDAFDQADAEDNLRAVVWANFQYGRLRAGGTPPEAA